MKHTTKLFAGALALTLLLGACGDSTSDDTSGGTVTTATTPGATGDQDQDRDRDRDRIHQLLDTATIACSDRDRDRLRELVTNRVHQIIEAQGLEPLGATQMEIVDEAITFDGDGAQVEVRLRITGDDEAPYEVRTNLRLQQGAAGEWLLDDVPFCIPSDETPTTLRDQDQDQDRDQDRETSTTAGG